MDCKPTKYVEASNVVFEVKCLAIQDKIHTVHVECGLINRNYKVYKKGDFLQEKTFIFSSGENHNSCCLDNAHYVKFKGDCSLINFQYPLNKSKFNSDGLCNNYFNQLNVAYSLQKLCLLKFTYDSPCNNPTVHLPICNGLKCKEVIQLL